MYMRCTIVLLCMSKNMPCALSIHALTPNRCFVCGATQLRLLSLEAATSELAHKCRESKQIKCISWAKLDLLCSPNPAYRVAGRTCGGGQRARQRAEVALGQAGRPHHHLRMP